MYEVGTIIGTITIGITSDKTPGSRRSPVALVSMAVAFMISLSFVVKYDEIEQGVYSLLLFCFGFFLNSVANLIVFTVSADLGR